MQRGQGHILDLGGVETQDTEIVDGVAVYGIDVAFLVVVEDAVSDERAGANNVL